MEKWRRIAHVCLVAAVVLLALMWVLDLKGILPFDFHKAALLVLIFVTFAYTLSTEVMARTMVQQRHEAVAPVVELDASGTRDIEVGFLNIGAGPALNFRCWIEDPQYPHLKSKRHCISRRAVGISHSDIASTGIIPTGLPNYSLGQGYIRAQYEDVFGITYETCLIFYFGELPELKYGLAKEKIVLRNILIDYEDEGENTVKPPMNEPS